VPETKMIDDLLRDFQRDKVHIAIVVDEFGGTSGIVTMEDIIEEIVGEINDEYDDDERSFTRLNQNTFVFEGKTLLTDFTRTLKLDDEYFEQVQGEADTLAGLLLEIKGDFPDLHEKIAYRRCAFEVMELDERRIVSIKVILKPVSEQVEA
jgi:CBS domain containing-hemolysin-like protein